MGFRGLLSHCVGIDLDENVMRLLRSFALVFGIWLFWGCASTRTTPTALPSPTPPPALRVFRVPEARILDAAWRSCARQQNLLLLFEDLSYPPSPPPGGLWLTWGPHPWRPDVPGYTLTEWSLRPVVHATVGVKRITVDTVQDIYRGVLRSWAEVGGEDVPLLPLLPPPGHPLYPGLEALIAPFPWPGDLTWVTSPEEVLRLTQDRVGTLGWLPEPWWRTAREEGLQVLTVDRAPEDLLGPWPLLLQWAPEVEVPAAFLGCLQRQTSTLLTQEAAP